MAAAEPLALALGAPELLRDGGLIGGSWVREGGGGRFAVEDPATGAVVAELPRMGAAETDRAIAAAEAALRPWRSRPARERAALLRAWFELVVAHQDDLATLITAEQGKPRAEARGEVLFAASFLEWFGEEAKRVYGETIPAPSADRRLFVTHDAIGVGAAITPWNFPAAMITRKAGAALAAGCPLVVKPAEQAPLTALALAWLAQEAGIPAGVVNVVLGAAEDAPAIGSAITASPVVRAISFTGSTAVGKLLMRQCADTVKRVSLELGGNAALLVFEDADLDAAVAGTIASAFRNAGQTCVCARRLIVHERVHDAFCEKLAAAVGALKVGAGTEPGVDIGPLIDDAAVAKVRRHVEGAVADGARIVTGGRPHVRGGRFWEPTVLAGVDPAMEVCCEETFGPVVGVIPFADEAEALALANGVPSGLAGYAFTRDAARQWRLAAEAECGVLGINTGLISVETAPFGGVKESGLGREGAREGVAEWLETKYVCLGGL